MDFSVTILGSGAALPTNQRQCSAQLVQIHNHLLLIDCGENTQVALRKHKVKIQKINHIFISHLHGDHFLGLPGLLFSLHLLGRVNPIHIYTPPGLKEIIDLLILSSKSHIKYEIHYHELHEGKSETILDEEKFSVITIPLLHQVQTQGFLIKEKQALPNIKKSFVKKHAPTIDEIKKIKQGEDFITPKGERIPNSQITIYPNLPKSYAYCSDTAYYPEILEIIQGVDTLYHEATFGAGEETLASEKFHTTSTQAAQIALAANAKQLILGHISARYKDATPLQEEAKKTFHNTLLAEDGMIVTI